MRISTSTSDQLKRSLVFNPSQPLFPQSPQFFTGLEPKDHVQDESFLAWEPSASKLQDHFYLVKVFPRRGLMKFIFGLSLLPVINSHHLEFLYFLGDLGSKYLISFFCSGTQHPTWLKNRETRCNHFTHFLHIPPAPWRCIPTCQGETTGGLQVFSFSMKAS